MKQFAPNFLRLSLLVSGVILSLAGQVAAQAYFDHDLKADFGVFRPGEESWYTFSSAEQTSATTRWGLTDDIRVPADYDGDGITDFAVWRPSNGTWYILASADGRYRSIKWGASTAVPYGNVLDEPVPADFDGDGKTDIAVWRPANGIWYVLYSKKEFDPDRAGYFSWGKLGDIPVQSDYDGDGKADFAVYRYTEQRWYVHDSSDGKMRVAVFGRAGTDKLVPADYTGDGLTDIAVYRSGEWFIKDSATGEMYVFRFGNGTDIPVPADYDGDGMTDLGVFRDGVWYVEEIVSGESFVFNYGRAGDLPVSSAVVKRSSVAIPFR